MMTTKQFLEAIEQHLAAHDIAASRFGKDVLGDPSFVFDLRSGRQPNLESVNKVLDSIKAREAASETEALAS